MNRGYFFGSPSKDRNSLLGISNFSRPVVTKCTTFSWCFIASSCNLKILSTPRVPVSSADPQELSGLKRSFSGRGSGAGGILGCPSPPESRYLPTAYVCSGNQGRLADLQSNSSCSSLSTPDNSIRACSILKCAFNNCLSISNCCLSFSSSYSLAFIFCSS